MRIFLSGLIPKWSFFSHVGNSKTLRELARWFVFVPILARLLATVAREVAQLPQLNFVSHLTLPYDWQLLYYSAFSFMIAGVVYELRAPRLFRDYPDYFQFSRAGQEKGDLSTKEVIDYLLEAVAFGKNHSTEDKVLGILRLADDPRSHILWAGRLSTIENVDQALNSTSFSIQERVMRRYIWRLCNRCRISARALCLIFYSAGFLLLATAFTSDLHTVFVQSSETGLLNHIKEVIGLSPEHQE